MDQTKQTHFTKKFILLSLLMVLFCMSFRLPVSAASVSVNNIQEAKEGTFIKKSGKWMYQYKDGSYAKKCLLNIKGKIYYFSTSGYRKYGFQKIGKYKYYFGSSNEGYMYQSKWLKTEKGNYYYLKANGKCATGWLTLKKKTYYFNKEGKRQSGWKTISGKKYYLGTASQGYKYTNKIVRTSKHTYYLNKNGNPATGWKTVSGKRYYFKKNGQAYTGRHKISGTYYTFDSKGVLISTGAKLTVSSDCAILINADTGKVLFEKSADTKHANASTTKIMTCILALENAKLTDTVTASANAAAQEPTKLYMKAGETFTLKDLLYSLMLPSHNDTAVALAEHISGSTDKFAQLMNQKAKALSCTNTNFITPNGLDNDGVHSFNHYTTARDMAKIAQYALKNSTFRQIIGTSTYSFKSKQGNAYKVSTTNALLGSLSGIIGGKTGYTNKAGQCFVGAVKGKNGNTYISVTLGASSSTARWNDARTLLNYAYKLK